MFKNMLNFLALQRFAIFIQKTITFSKLPALHDKRCEVWISV